MLKIQELPGDMPLEPHCGTAPGSRGARSATIEGLPPPPPVNTPSGSSPVWYQPISPVVTNPGEIGNSRDR